MKRLSLAFAVAATAVLFWVPTIANAEWFSSRAYTSSRWPGEARELSMSGNKIAYSKYHDGNQDIFVFDLATRVEKRITSNAAEQSKPCISGNRVVWQDMRNGNYDIYSYDLVARKTKRLTSSPALQWMPTISGSRVVWSDQRNYPDPSSGRLDLYQYNFATNTEKKLTSGASDTRPALSGTKLAFMRSTQGQSARVTFMNLGDTGTHTLDSGGALGGAAISGNYVVWSQLGDFGYDVFCYNVSLDRGRQLTIGVQGLDARISGTQVVYKASIAGEPQLHVYDVATDEVHLVTSEGTSDHAISGSTIAYGIAGGLGVAQPAYPSIAATIPSSVAFGTRAQVTGVFKSPRGTGVAGEAVTLESSVDGRVWQSVDTTATGEGGAFALRSAPIIASRYLRVSFTQCEHYRYAKSARVLVTAQAH
jgi:beta propeller repeat protein